MQYCCRRPPFQALAGLQQNPRVLFSVRLLPLNPVPAAFVLYVTVVALALAAIMKTAPAIEAAGIKRMIFTSIFLLLFVNPLPGHRT